MRYAWKRGVRLTEDAAQIIGERVATLAEAGPLQAQDLVEDARHPISPIHPYFEWDDQAAAEQYRIVQARHYLRSITIVREESDPEDQVRAFHVVSIQREDTEERGYLPLDVVVSQSALLWQVIDKERQRLQSVARNLRQYQSLRHVADGPLQATIDALLAASVAEPVEAA